MLLACLLAMYCCECSASSSWQIAVGASGAAIVLAVVAILIVMKRRGTGVTPSSSSSAKGGDRPTVAFTNPVYANSSTPHGQDDHGQGLYTDVGANDALYDQPSAVSQNGNHRVFNPLYAAQSDENIYAEGLAGSSDEDDPEDVDAVGDADAGGYLDINPEEEVGGFDSGDDDDVNAGSESGDGDNDGAQSDGSGFDWDSDE